MAREQSLIGFYVMLKNGSKFISPDLAVVASDVCHSDCQFSVWEIFDSLGRLRRLYTLENINILNVSEKGLELMDVEKFKQAYESKLTPSLKRLFDLEEQVLCLQESKSIPC